MDSFTSAKSLRILTLDGGGLQAVSTLLILNKVLERIAKENGVPVNEKPRPCDVFDTIAGIGTGGWLAILLGRFRMDVTACLAEWHNLMQCIVPSSETERLRLRLLHDCYFDMECLVEQVKLMSEKYGTRDCLFESDTRGARTRHVLVAAPTSDAKRYNLFRSYEIPKSAKPPAKLLEGPHDPSSFEISRAFGATFASRYFTSAWEEQMASSGKTRFKDVTFPEPHNITQLALDEMWAIYGTDVPLSVVINIGPGLPDAVDIKQITRAFPWSLNPRSFHRANSTKLVKSPAIPWECGIVLSSRSRQSSPRFCSE